MGFPAMAACQKEAFVSDRMVEEVDKLLFCRIRDVKMPNRAHETDAGIDFFVPNDFGLPRQLIPGEDVCIPSGIKVKVPRGWALIIKEKSGVAVKKRLGIGACVIDSDYLGEVHIHVYNFGIQTVAVLPGEKIAQGVLVPVGLHVPTEISHEEYKSLFQTERGEGGFGSTGVM